MKHIHLVDDEPHIIRITRMSLERAGYRVTDSSNGLQALEQLALELPDLLITDIDMPRMNGQELCAEIVRQWPQRTFPIYILTSRAETEHRLWSADIDNLKFLEKPISLRGLLADLESCFDDPNTGMH